MRKPLANSSESCFRAETHFPKAYKMQKLIKCVFDTKIRLQWETTTAVFFKNYWDSKGLTSEKYTCGTSMLGVSPRDWLEKTFEFWDGERYINYSSSICQEDGNSNPLS